MIELGLVLLGVIGGIAIGYGWGRIAERQTSRKTWHGWRGRSPDPSDEAGA